MPYCRFTQCQEDAIKFKLFPSYFVLLHSFVRFLCSDFSAARNFSLNCVDVIFFPCSADVACVCRGRTWASFNVTCRMSEAKWKSFARIEFRQPDEYVADERNWRINSFRYFGGFSSGNLWWAHIRLVRLPYGLDEDIRSIVGVFHHVLFWAAEIFSAVSLRIILFAHCFASALATQIRTHTHTQTGGYMDYDGWNLYVCLGEQTVAFGWYVWKGAHCILMRFAKWQPWAFYPVSLFISSVQFLRLHYCSVSFAAISRNHEVGICARTHIDKVFGS